MTFLPEVSVRRGPEGHLCGEGQSRAEVLKVVVLAQCPRAAGEEGTCGIDLRD